MTDDIIVIDSIVLVEEVEGNDDASKTETQEEVLECDDLAMPSGLQNPIYRSYN